MIMVDGVPEPTEAEKIRWEIEAIDEQIAESEFDERPVAMFERREDGTIFVVCASGAMFYFGEADGEWLDFDPVPETPAAKIKLLADRALLRRRIGPSAEREPASTQ